MSRNTFGYAGLLPSFPRLRGDEPKTADSMAEKLGFSPPTRG